MMRVENKQPILGFITKPGIFNASIFWTKKSDTTRYSNIGGLSSNLHKKKAITALLGSSLSTTLASPRHQVSQKQAIQRYRIIFRTVPWSYNPFLPLLIRREMDL
jgi:hypothetical protein